VWCHSEVEWAYVQSRFGEGHRARIGACRRSRWSKNLGRFSAAGFHGTRALLFAAKIQQQFESWMLEGNIPVVALGIIGATRIKTRCIDSLVDHQSSELLLDSHGAQSMHCETGLGSN